MIKNDEHLKFLGQFGAKVNEKSKDIKLSKIKNDFNYVICDLGDEAIIDEIKLSNKENSIIISLKPFEFLGRNRLKRFSENTLQLIEFGYKLYIVSSEKISLTNSKLKIDEIYSLFADEIKSLVLSMNNFKSNSLEQYEVFNKTFLKLKGKIYFNDLAFNSLAELKDNYNKLLFNKLLENSLLALKNVYICIESKESLLLEEINQVYGILKILNPYCENILLDNKINSKVDIVRLTIVGADYFIDDLRKDNEYSRSNINTIKKEIDELLTLDTKSNSSDILPDYIKKINKYKEGK